MRVKTAFALLATLLLPLLCCGCSVAPQAKAAAEVAFDAAHDKMKAYLQSPEGQAEIQRGQDFILEKARLLLTSGLTEGREATIRMLRDDGKELLMAAQERATSAAKGIAMDYVDRKATEIQAKVDAGTATPFEKALMMLAGLAGVGGAAGHMRRPTPGRPT